MVDEILFALKQRWPNILVQFEDFHSDNAYPILTRNRKKYLCFNDDIQGTGAVALGGIYAALRVQGKKPSALKDQVFSLLFFKNFLFGKMNFFFSI